MRYGLVHASGPTPADPVAARTLGYEERKLGEMMDADVGAFRMYCHAASVPELVSFVRAVGRDATFEPFGESQALIYVAAAEAT